MLFLSVKDYFRTYLVENGTKGEREGGGPWREGYTGTRNCTEITLLFYQDCCRGTGFVPPYELLSSEPPLPQMTNSEKGRMRNPSLPKLTLLNLPVHDVEERVFGEMTMDHHAAASRKHWRRVGKTKFRIVLYSRLQGPGSLQSSDRSTRRYVHP